jgi:hypothetical protein
MYLQGMKIRIYCLRVCDIASRKEWLLKQFEEAGKNLPM